MRFLVQHLHRGRIGKPIDQRHHANGSSGVRHQLLCLQGQVLSTDSRWSDGIGIHHDLSEHLHVGMGTVLRSNINRHAVNSMAGLYCFITSCEYGFSISSAF